jgi:hypothetical protein
MPSAWQRRRRSPRPPCWCTAMAARCPTTPRACNARLAGKKQLAWIDKGTQSDFYDVPELVNSAADRDVIARHDAGGDGDAGAEPEQVRPSSRVAGERVAIAHG